jgi:nucleoid-associated protein YgaU
MKMTSDAKIGLLLGLIFIFIIAFILNGLPGLHGKGGSNQATAEDLSNLSSSSVNPPLTQPGGVASSMGAPAGGGGEDVRYKISLGGPADKATDVKAIAPTDSTPSPLCPADGNAPAPKIAMGDAKSGLVDLSPTPVDKPVARSSTDGTAMVPDAGIQSTQVDAPKASDYTIVSGDSPAKIAVKVYGAKEGNKEANVKKLMATNNIKDPSKLVVGRKLTIPALPTGPEALTVTHPESFSKVSGTSTKTTKSDAKTSADAKSDTKLTAPAPKADVKPAPQAGREYTVVNGDNLWKIAAKTLGDGKRYNDILKLNSAKLGKDGAKLAVGMKLQIPAK